MGTTCGHADTIEQVVERMQEIDDHLPLSDGVAYFNRLYLQTTLEIQHRRARGAFEDRDFLDRLDVDFANIYFDAHYADEQHLELPAAWATVFRLRRKSHTLPIQFALAGMNVHINHDLPVAVVRTCQELGRTPAEDTPAYRDFQRTNDALRDVNSRVRHWFESGLIATMDEDCGSLDDAMEMWSLAEIRDVAWRHAELIWHLRTHPELHRAYLNSLTLMVDVATRGILI